MTGTQRDAAPRAMARQRGWTLTELAATLAVLGILGALGYAEYGRYVMRAKAIATVEQLTVVRIAMIRFEGDCGMRPMPSADGGDPGLSHAPAVPVAGWEGPYLDSWPGTTPLGGHVLYMAAGPSPGETAALRVDGLSAVAADMLFQTARTTFGDGVEASSQTGAKTPLSHSVACALGDRDGGGAKPPRRVSGK
jgi:general secretion pathway protein G